MAGADGGRGHFVMPRELWRDATRLLTPSQRLVLVAMIAEANYSPGHVTLPDGSRLQLERGEVLVGGRTFADRHGLSHKVVRTTLARLKALGWADLWPAEGTPQGTPPVRRRAHGEGTPPTVVRLNVHRQIMWPDAGEGTPQGHGAGHTPRPREGTIQQRTIQQEPSTSSGADEFHDEVAALLGVEAQVLVTAKAGKEGEVRRRVDAQVQRLGLARCLEVAEDAIWRWGKRHPDDPPSSLAFFVDALERARPARKANGVAKLPRHWWTVLPREDFEAFLVAREQLSPHLDRQAPVEVTTVAGVEVPGALKLLDGLREKATARLKGAA